MNKVVIGVIGAVVAVGTAIGVGVSIPSAPTRTTVTVPASYGGHTIANDCTSDATAGLNAFLASLAANTTVNFPPGACYQVSPYTGDTLGISNTTGLTLNGNGATLDQTVYQMQPAAPTLPGVTPTCTGTCTTTWDYEITSLGTISGESTATGTSTTGGAATLSATDYNTVSWRASTGAASYNVYRYNGTAYVLIGNTTTTSFADTGQTAGTQNPPVTGNALTNGCAGGNPKDFVLALSGNTNLTVNDLTVKGPVATGGNYNCQGDNGNHENDTGIMIGASSPGDTGDTFNQVTVENLNGDAFDMGQMGGSVSASHNIVFQNGTLSNWGWYGIVPQSVDGFNFTGSTANGGGFLDAEVDNNCGMPATGGGQAYWDANCLNGNGGLATEGIWNMAIVDSTFNVSNFVINVGGQGCTPQKNWTIAGNNFTTGSGSVNLSGSNGNTDCPDDNTGFTYTDNTGPGPGSFCGTGGAPYPCAAIEMDAWANVDISNNTLTWPPTSPAGTERTVTDGVLTAGSDVVTSATANFTSADACGETNGCYISVPPLGNGKFTITSVTNSTTAVLNGTASANATGVTLGIGQIGSSAINQPVMEAVGLCSVTGATVRNNDFSNAYGLWDATNCDTPNNSSIVTSGVATCGNNWGLTTPQPYWTYSNNSWGYVAAPAANPQTDSNC